MERMKLIEIAKQASQNAYSPFSGYKVGVALLTRNGKVFTGCNVENSSYGLSMCAERTAIFKAVSEGETDFEQMVIYVDADELFSPCGACRQVMSEFGDDIKVTIVTNKQEVETNIAELLPLKFEL